MTLWWRFVRWLNYEDERLTPISMQPPNMYLQRLAALEASVADVVLGRKLERWCNTTVAPEFTKLEDRIKHLEEHMATHADLPPVVQGLVQSLEGLGAKLDTALAELAETRTALEAQTDKYKMAVQERDAALERERIASQELDKHQAALLQVGELINKSRAKVEESVTSKGQG